MNSHVKPLIAAIAIALSTTVTAAPASAGSNDDSFVGKVKSYSANAWQKTEKFFGADKAADAAAQNQPQSFGRAGGYVGADRVEKLNSPNPGQANSNATGSELVRTGNSQGNAAANSTQQATALDEHISHPVDVKANRASPSNASRESTALKDIREPQAPASQ